MEDAYYLRDQAEKIRDKIWSARDAVRDAKERHKDDTDVEDAEKALDEAYDKVDDLVDALQEAGDHERDVQAEVVQLIQLLGLSDWEYELMKNGLACRTPAEFLRERLAAVGG